MTNMGSEPQQSSPYPYATPDKPRHLTDDDLTLLSRYTGEKDLDKLREHVYKIWRAVKSEVHPFNNICNAKAT